MATQSSDNFDTAVEALAKQAVYNGEYRRLRKEGGLAETLKTLGSSAVSHLKSSPALGAGLVGAGLGGAYGAATSYANDDDTRSPLRSGITGALAGGALGAGAGLAGSSLHKYLKNRPQSGEPAAGRFTQGGKEYALRPGAEKILPQISELESRSPVTRGVGAVTDSVLGYAKNHPLLAAIMAGDIGTHAIGSAAEFTSAGRGGGATLEHFRKGLTSLDKAKDNLVGEDKRQALTRWLDGIKNPAQFHEEYTKAIREGKGISVKGVPGKAKPGGKAPAAKNINITPRTLQDVGHAGTGSVRPGGARSIGDIFHAIKGDASRTPLHNTGYDTSLPGWLQKTLQRASSNPRPTSMATRVGGRVGLYAGLPALQWYLGQTLTEMKARSKMKSLMQQNAVPVQ